MTPRPASRHPVATTAGAPLPVACASVSLFYFFFPRRKAIRVCDGDKVSENLPKRLQRDFPGHPEVTTWPSNAGRAGSVPGWGPKSPQAGKPRNQNIKEEQYIFEIYI